jgi:hypothetical protein
MSASNALSVKSAEPTVSEPAAPRLEADVEDEPLAVVEDELVWLLLPQAASIEVMTTGSVAVKIADRMVRFMVLLGLVQRAVADDGGA